MLATKFYPLAGLRIDPARSARRVVRPYTGIVLSRVADGQEIPIKIPEGSRLGRPQWSHDGRKLAFTRLVEDGVELWIADCETGEAKRVLDRHVGTVLGAGFSWMPGSNSLLVHLIPQQRGPEPPTPVVPDGPHTQDTAGRAAQNRTYQDLLRNRHDGEVFAHHATTQLAVIELSSATVRTIGTPAIFRRAEPSPDGKHLLITTLEAPFSFVVPYYRFPRTLAVWGVDGSVKEQVAKLPASEEVPIQGVPTGPRSLQWQPFHPATVVWVEALDGGDPRTEVAHRDRMMRQSVSPPGEPVEVMKVAQRHVSSDFTSNKNQVFVTEYDRDRRWVTTRVHALDTPGSEQVLFDRSVNDRYGDPGDPVYTRLADGSDVVRVDDGWIYLTGNGATPKGDRPFLDRRKLADATTEHLMQSPGDSYVKFVA
ncbi:MAG: S9 family peptidase, partial [Nannocystaceae bacterium]